MRDLYRRNKLRPRESDRVEIHNCAGSDADKEAAFTVLLNAEKKAEYDRAHTTLSNIGYVRRHLGLGGKSNWRLRYDDFLHPAEADPPRSTSKARKPAPVPKSGAALLLSWPVVSFALLILLPLAYLALVYGDQDKIALDQSFDKRMHTVSSQVAVYPTPDTDSARLMELEEFRDLTLDPEQSTSRWAYVQVGEEGAGYVLREALAAGSGEAGQVARCREYGIWRPENEQHLGSGRTGKNTLIVVNPPGKDALVKLKDHEGSTEVFFYVRGGETAMVETIPEGRFQFQYAVGDNYSPNCGRFLDNMQTTLDPKFMTFSASNSGPAGASSVATHTLKTGTYDHSIISNRSF